MTEGEVEVPPPELDDWDVADLAPSAVRTGVIGVGVLVAVVACAWLAIAVLDDRDAGEPPRGTAPMASGSVDLYNPSGYDGAGADAVLDRVTLADNGEAIVLGFADVLPPDIERTRSAEAGRGDCEAPPNDPVGDEFVNLWIDGGLDLSELEELAEPSGSIVTGLAPLGAVRSLTITCHGPSSTVLAIGLVGDRFVTVDERPDNGLVLLEFFTR